MGSGTWQTLRKGQLLVLLFMSSDNSCGFWNYSQFSSLLWIFQMNFTVKMFVCLQWSGILANQAGDVCSLETFCQDNWQEIELGAATIFSRLSNHASLVSRLGQSGFCLHLQKAVSVGVRWLQASGAACAIGRLAKGREKWHTSMSVCFCLPTAGRVRAGVCLLNYILLVLVVWLTLWLQVEDLGPA